MIRRIAIALLAAAACVNVAAGVVLALRDPARASDLQVMADWCREWLLAGRSLYTGSEASADYPPNAIVMLSPLALVPARWLVPLWTAFAVALTPVLPWLVLRAASPSRDRAALVIPALLFLCWAAPRTLLQFSLLSMVLAGAALVLADRRWIASGIALGLALGKPHLAGPIAIWMLITGRVRPLTTALVVVAAGWIAYDARIAENPLITIAGYWRVLGSEYAGAAGLVGHTSLRGWARLITADSAIGDTIWIAMAVLLLAALCLLAMRGRSRALDQGGMAVPAMFCLWSLLATYHNGNNLILMLPAFAFLWFHKEPAPPWRWLAIAALQAAMMYDVPVRLAGAGPVIAQADRLVVITTLTYVCFLWSRLPATPAAARAPQSPR